MKRKVGIEEIAKAIELNGYPQAKHVLIRSTKGGGLRIREDEAWKKHDVGDIEQACALGEAALNLGVGAIELQDNLNSLSPTLYVFITHQNDTTKKSFRAIARSVRREYLPNDTTVELEEFDWGSVFSNYQGKKV